MQSAIVLRSRCLVHRKRFHVARYTFSRSRRYFHPSIRCFSASQVQLEEDEDGATGLEPMSINEMLLHEQEPVAPKPLLMPSISRRLSPSREADAGNDCFLSELDEPGRKKSAAEILRSFDPQNPPETDDLEEMQIWLECEAQQECVRKYQGVLDDARDRNDYSSLSLVQKQVLWWFEPLCDAFEAMQRDYLLKRDVDDQTTVSQKRYGPYICTLPPSKLAVIAAHAAIVHTLTAQQDKDGVLFPSLASKLGEAVEDEVLIQHVLHKRFLESQQRMKNPTESIAAELLTDQAHQGDDAKHASGVKELRSRDKWLYSASHLRSYLDEVKKRSSRKGRSLTYALRRARQLLESDEPWGVREKVQLGAAMMKALLDHATVRLGGKEEPAFTYEKRWTGLNKTKSFVSLHPKLQEVILSDKLQSFSNTTTRQKPMIVQPKPWKSPSEGGYRWLKTDLVRAHGCNLQLVRLPR